MGLISLPALRRAVARLKKQGKKIVFTNGCFDLLHAGHVHLLRRAKALGDVLVVGLNTDSSVRKLKGRGHPLMPQKDRALVLSSLRFVDYVVFFSEPTPADLIRSLTPDVLVKGADYKTSAVVGADWVLAKGGRVVRVSLLKGRSSSKLLRKLKYL